MKKKLIFGIVLLFSFIVFGGNTFGEVLWSESFEGYTNGSTIAGNNGWIYVDGTGTGVYSNTYSSDGSYSAYLGGGTDYVISNNMSGNYSDHSDGFNISVDVKNDGLYWFMYYDNQSVTWINPKEGIMRYNAGTNIQLKCNNVAYIDTGYSAPSGWITIRGEFTDGNIEYFVNETSIYNCSSSISNVSNFNSKIWIRTYGGPYQYFDNIIFENGKEEVTRNFTITAKDYYDNGNICNFTALINGTSYDSNITACELETDILENSTSLYNITISSNNYYNISYNNYNVSSDLEAKPYQVIVRLNATEIITENALNGLFDDGTNSNETILYLNAGSHNITFVNSSYYNQTQEFTFVALDNVSRTIENVSDSILRINATDLTDDSSISNFSITIELNNASYTYTFNDSTTSGELNISLLNNQNYFIFIDAEGYELDNTSVVVNATLYNYSFDLYTTNSIQFNFFDSDTKATINNVTFNLISDVYSTNLSTTNGSYYVDLLSPATYRIEYESDGYKEGIYYFTLVNRTFTNLSLYLSNSTDTSIITATLYDEVGNLIEDGYIKVMKYDVTTNSYILQEIQKTNFEGTTLLNLVKNNVNYKFIIEYPYGTIVEETGETRIYSDTITFRIRLESEVLLNFQKSQNIDYTLNYTGSDSFKFVYNDPDNLVSQGCLYVYVKSRTGGLSLYNSSCSASAVGSITLDIANTTGSYYIAKAYATISGEEQLIDTAVWEYTEFDGFGAFGVFIVILATILFALSGYYSPALAVILTPIPMVVGSILSLITIPIGVSLSIFGICIVVAVMSK